MKPQPSARARRPPAQDLARDTRESVAVFLGAGASKAFGYPLTWELLPQLYRYLKDGTLETWKYSKAERDLLDEGLCALLPGISGRARRELPLITDVLSLIDHSIVSGTSVFRRWPTTKVAALRGLFEQVIADLVGPDGSERTRKFRKFASWMKRAYKSHRVGVVTTNYDIELELELFDHFGHDKVAEKMDFGMNWREPAGDESIVYPRPPRPAIAYYKLHGSLNWLRCPLCEHIYVNVAGVIVGWAWEKRISRFNTCHCGHAPLQSVLVTPSYVRDGRDVNLLAIWRNALDLLSTADRWIIIGYSMPAEDLAIRTLLIKAAKIRERLALKRKLKLFIVQRPGKEQRLRYDLLFPHADYHDCGIEGFDFDAALDVAPPKPRKKAPARKKRVQ